MLRFLAVPAILLVFGVAASAAPADCLAAVTLQDLINDNASGGCQHLDKVFSNFAYSQTNASSVLVTHEFTASPSGTNDIHGWLFSLPGEWTTGFTLSYDISIAPGFPNQRISAEKDQENSGLTPNGTQIVDTLTTTPAGSYTNTVTGAGAETHQVNFAPIATGVHTSSVFTPGGGALASFEQDFFETSTVPEPAAFGLCGGALILLGLLRKRIA